MSKHNIVLINGIRTAEKLHGSIEHYTQASHGFSAGDVVTFSTTWALADADTAADRLRLGGVVSLVLGTNDFIVTHKGVVGGFSSLTAGDTQYTSTTAGDVSTTVSNRVVGVAVSTTEIFVDMGLGSGDVVKLYEVDAATDATIDFTSTELFDGTYKRLEIRLSNFKPSADGATLLFRVSTSSTWRTTGYKSTQARATGGSLANRGGSGNGVEIFYLHGSATNETGSAVFHLEDLSVTGFKRLTGTSTQADTGASCICAVFAGVYEGTTAWDGIRLLYDSGNIVTGKITIYGYK